jgi:hypothetical protein
MCCIPHAPTVLLSGVSFAHQPIIHKCGPELQTVLRDLAHKYGTRNKSNGPAVTTLQEEEAWVMREAD